MIVKKLSRVLLSVALVAGSATPALAQWATSGSNIYNTNTGNVGIGTTAPSQKLEVNGGIMIPVSDTAAFGTKRGSVFNKLLWQGVGGADADVVFLSNPNNNYIRFKTFGVDHMSISNTGNVGIGITSPSYKLHVGGDTSILGSIRGTTAVYAKVYVSSAVNVPGDGIWRKVDFNAEDFDQFNMHGSFSSLVTIPSTFGGLYTAECNVTFAGNANGVRGIRVVKNGLAVAEEVVPASPGGWVTSLNISGTYQGNAGDYFECFVLQNSGTSLNLLYAPSYSPWFTVRRST